MSERQFAVCRDWALGADSLQWIIYKRASKLKGGWYGVSFVSSRRTILERCMREKGCPELNRTVLLAGLPEPSTNGIDAPKSFLRARRPQ